MRAGSEARNASNWQATSQIAPRAWRRHLHLMIDGFRAADRHELPEPPLTEEQLYQAMAHLGE